MAGPVVDGADRVWTNAPARVYHGTTLTHAQGIIRDGIDIERCRVDADFGQGFYVTTSRHQAEQWGNRRIQRLRRGQSDVAAVVGFDLNRDIAARHGDHLAFVMPDPAFFAFAKFNRIGGIAHGRAGLRPYDLVHGPVSAFPQTTCYANSDQICFSRPDWTLIALGSPTLEPGLGDPIFR